MSLLNIDPEKCRSDGICAAECPMSLLVQADPEAPPTLVPGAEDFCINCGHCMAVCPHGALTLDSMDRDLCTPMDPNALPGPDQVDLALRSRRSIRVYRDEALDQATLQELIEVARYAPSGHNRQPLHWLVISDREELKRLGGIVVDWMRFTIEDQPAVAAMLHLKEAVQLWEGGYDMVLRNAPHIVVTHAPKQEYSAPAASTIALSYLDLAASARGLGACWAGYFMRVAQVWPAMAEALDLPEGHICFGAMMLGRPRFKYQLIPLRDEPPITFR